MVAFLIKKKKSPPGVCSSSCCVLVGWKTELYEIIAEQQ